MSGFAMPTVRDYRVRANVSLLATRRALIAERADLAERLTGVDHRIGLIDTVLWERTINLPHRPKEDTA